MINTIFSILEIQFTDEQFSYFSQYTYVAKLPESRTVDGRALYQGNSASIEEVESIKAVLENLGAIPEIIGIWNNNGLRYGYKYDDDDNIIRDPNIETIPYPFNITQYSYYLKDIKEYDNDGQEISSRRPTIEEARNMQVNKFFGMPNRDLKEY